MLKAERTESESISFSKQWYLLGILNLEIILEKKPLKILNSSVPLEIFLPFSIKLVFSPFKGLFVKRGIIVFQKVLLHVTFFISRLLQYDFFVVLSKFEVILISFSSVLQELIS